MRLVLELTAAEEKDFEDRLLALAGVRQAPDPAHAGAGASEEEVEEEGALPSPLLSPCLTHRRRASGRDDVRADRRAAGCYRICQPRRDGGGGVGAAQQSLR